MIKLDLSKPVTRRDGKEVNIICTNRNMNSGRSLMYLYKGSATGYDQVCTVFSNGRYNEHDGQIYDSVSDLINVPEETLVEKWLVLYKSGAQCFFTDKPTWVDKSNCVLAMKKVSFKVKHGEGLDNA
jgi:hypothetical protein